MLSLATARSGDWSGARKAAEKALALRSGDARDYLLQALALHHQGQIDAASQAAEAARRWAETNRVYDQPLVDQLRAEEAALVSTGVPELKKPPQPAPSSGTNRKRFDLAYELTFERRAVGQEATDPASPRALGPRA
jgi:hypothetical protein